jgi:hypothetical protein
MLSATYDTPTLPAAIQDRAEHVQLYTAVQVDPYVDRRRSGWRVLVRRGRIEGAASTVDDVRFLHQASSA